MISVRPYTHTDHYWQVYFDTNEAITRVAKEADWPPADAGRQHAQRRQSVDRRIGRPALIETLNALKSAYDFPATLR